MRLQVTPTGAYTYPDVVVVCGDPQFADRLADTLLNPALIIEVLSDSTADYDRGGKFHQYMRIPTLREYLTVSQSERLVDLAVRQADDSWVIREIGEDATVVPLGSLGIELQMADIYEKAFGLSSDLKQFTPA
jgi:Uma2 family endonuclease